jgi:hypothetical protein
MLSRLLNGRHNRLKTIRKCQLGAAIAAHAWTASGHRLDNLPWIPSYEYKEAGEQKDDEQVCAFTSGLLSMFFTL